MTQKQVHIYTDGACSRNPGYGGWAFVVICDGKIYASRTGAAEHTTNNRMELMAAIKALSFISFDKELRSEEISVYTDSQYLQQGAINWMPLWKERRWRNSDREQVKNRDLWEKLDALLEVLTVKWLWVRGHTGNEYNELCDKLTKEAIRDLAKRLEEKKRRGL